MAEIIPLGLRAAGDAPAPAAPPPSPKEFPPNEVKGLTSFGLTKLKGYGLGGSILYQLLTLGPLFAIIALVALERPAALRLKITDLEQAVKNRLAEAFGLTPSKKETSPPRRRRRVRPKAPIQP